MNEFVRKFEGSMEEQRGGDGAEMRVEEYDSLMMSCAEEVLQITFKKRNTRKVKVSEPVWMTEEIREEIKNRKEINRKKNKLQRRGKGGKFETILPAK